MNARNLSRQLSTSVVDALKAHGHILVVKGGAAALAREIGELMAPVIEVVAPRIEPRGPLADEPTSTFGDEHADQMVEDMVARLTRALMSSDHVEDVFAEDAVIRRDIFRAVQAGLMAPALRGEEAGEERSTLAVKLDTLGYVAATVSKRADADTLRQAFERAAAVAHARFEAYSPAQREATFHIERTGLDERLEIEEAVADELTDLAEQGVVQLPTVERRLELPRAISAAEQRALAARIDAVAASTLLQSGCAAAWDFVDGRTIRVTFTPLSDQDARGVDAPSNAFAREVAALLPAAAPPPASKAPAPTPTEPSAVAAPPAEAAPPSRRKARVKEPAPASAPEAAESAPEPAARPAPRKSKRAAEPATPAPKRKRAAASKTAASPRSSAKRTATKTTKAPAKKG